LRTYEGTHTSNVKDRFEQKVWPFSSPTNLLVREPWKAQAKGSKPSPHAKI